MGIFGFGKDKDTENATQEQPVQPEVPESPVSAPETPVTDSQQAAEPTSKNTAAEKTGSAKEKKSTTGYKDNEEHLWHVLEWADQLVRAQTVRWRKTIAANKQEQYWGMVHVTDQEVGMYLQAPFMRANELPQELVESLLPYWNTAQTIVDLIEKRLQKTPDSITLRLLQLEKLFGLSSLEIAVLLVCLLPELDGRYRRLFGFLQDDASRTRPGVELVLQILQPISSNGQTARSVFNESAALRTNHLLQITDLSGGSDPLSAHALSVDVRVVDYLLGSDQPDNRLKALITESEASQEVAELILEDDVIARLHDLSQWLNEIIKTTQAPPVFFLHGRYGSGRFDAAQALCKEVGIPLLRVDTALTRQLTWSTTVDLILREARLRGAAVYWNSTETLRVLEQAQTQDQWDYLAAAIEQHSGLVFLESETLWEPAGHLQQKGFIRIDFTAPGYSLRKKIWEHYLPSADMFAETIPETEQLASLMANGFQLTGGQIRDSIATALGQARQRNPSAARYLIEDLYEGCRRQSSRSLITFARLIEPRSDLSFDDLILPESNKRQLNELRDRIRYRSQVYTGLGFERRLSLGKGLIALFTGSSGTGKTMAAELLGHEYGMQIYKIDLAAVVSKYVGETEKNLAKVFNEAEDANAILFFDEGEALFGKRGEVKEARDRWANTEVNYLLQRIEEYRGVVIITTNFRQNMDSAFLRRLHAAVDFPRPEAEARLRILRGMFPKDIARPDDDELRVLAKQFTLSGGNIKNVVLDAAFRSIADTGEEGAQITIRHLVLGIAREEQKMGRALTKGDFGEKYHAWVQEEIF
jgi:AAA+ superfamily predicted ATPase